MTADRKVAVRGIVTASEWDEAGNPTAVVILTRLEEEVAVECSGAGASLLDHLTREVVVCGYMAPGPGGGRVLRPLSYAVLDRGARWLDPTDGYGHDPEHRRRTT
jgi:hypothetical protein